jgi:hypothetical protein
MFFFSIKYLKTKITYEETRAKKEDVWIFFVYFIKKKIVSY